MRATLLWTINDFLALATLSGRSTRGRYACPHCGESTCSRWLKHGKKFCYLGHRRWLDVRHQFRRQKDNFDGTIELRTAPVPLSGSEVLSYLEGRDFTCQNMSKKRASSSKRKRTEQEDVDDRDDVESWKRKSILFELPYWEFNLIRHMIDFMHTEKNIAENCVGTMLNEKGKSKDNVKARYDLEDMGIRSVLQPKYDANGEPHMPPACYKLTKGEKDVFLQVFKKLKVPDGYDSNLSKCVNLKENKLQSLKSHDYHILMQDLLPLALRCSMSKQSTQVTAVMIELCNIMKGLCSKNLIVEDI